MKTSLGLILALVALQIPIPPPAPPPSPPQRRQVPNSAATATPLTVAQCKCSIEVTVKRHGGEPISDVDVTLSAAPQARVQVDANGQSRIITTPGDSNSTVTATTDASGHAIFRDLAQATYTIRAQRNGFLGEPQSNGPATIANQVGATVSVGPATTNTGDGTVDDGLIAFLTANAELRMNATVSASYTVPQPNHQVQLTMIQGATISGRTEDGNRRPLSGVPIGAFRVGYRDGQRTLAQVGPIVQTDDRGEYRLFWFPPGEYYIGTVSNTGPVRTQGYWTQTYYPGTMDPTRATPVVLREGQEYSGAGFSIPPSSGVTISGTIVNNVPGGRVLPNGQMSRNIASIYLVPRNPSFMEPPQLLPNASVGARGANPDPNNTPFEIRGVPPGTYDFYPIFNTGGTAPTALNAYYSGRTPIEVGSEDVKGVMAVIRPGIDLKGHLTITGTPPPSPRPQPFTTESVRLQLHSIDNLPALVAGPGNLVSVDKEGTFTLTNVTEARYMVGALLGLPADAYLSDLRMGAQSLYDDGVIVVGNTASETLEIVVSRGGATVQGTVQDAQHNPVAATRVVLIPDSPRRQNFQLYKSVPSNSMGNFTMSGVAPGAYKLFAWENIVTGAEQNAEFMREYDLRGVSIIVSSGTAVPGTVVPLISTKP